MRVAGLAVFLLAAAGCASTGTSRLTGPPASASHETLNATAWVQLSAEYRSIALQTYRSAETRLREALADTTWSAVYGRPTDSSLPPSIIVDVDETVLDNSPYQARLIATDTVFTRESWNRWVGEASAIPIPGAVEFLSAADAAGVMVFYITNRSSDLEEATRSNLAAAGFPVREDKDVVLTRGEQEEWTGDKASRRNFVSDVSRVVLIAGDDLNDFVSADDLTVEERDDLVTRTAEWWGQRWFMLPNPVYGSWERVLNRQADARTRDDQVRAKSAALRTR